MDVREANRHGQQLFLADMFRQKRPEPARYAPRSTAWSLRYPVAHRQLVLFETKRDYTTPRGRALSPPLRDLAEGLDHLIAEHAARHGWRRTMESKVCSAIHTLLAVQDTPGAPIKATDVVAVTTGWAMRNTKPVLEVLFQAGMLEDDRETSLDAYFARHAADLAAPVADEFGLWFHVLRDGSSTRPRCRPRCTATIRNYIASVSPALGTWTAAGIQSLREIERQDVLDTLPSDSEDRRQMLVALKLLFRFLKARRLVFANPTARMRVDPVTTNQPLPLDNLTLLHEAVNSPKPERAALATLIAFHALSAGEIRDLKLDDAHDGRVHIGRRTILLAAPVRAKLTEWLNERARRWPNTINPYLFVNQHTAVRVCPVDRNWITNKIGVSARALRDDRILHEAIATAGDLRRLCDLFGLGITSAERYCHTTDRTQEPSGSETEVSS